MRRGLVLSISLILFILIGCSSSEDSPETVSNPESPIVYYYLSLEDNNYDISNLFFIKNNDYAHPLLTCTTHLVNIGDVIKVVGETNIVSSDVVVNAIVKKNSETISNIQLTRSTSYLNQSISVNGLCYSSNSTFVASDVRLWKNDANSTTFTIQ